MGRRSKATVARLNNLKKPENSPNPTVEEVFDEDSDTDFEDENFLEHGFFFWMKNTHPRTSQMALTEMMMK